MSQIEREKQQVAEWIKDGFTRYAPRFSTSGGAEIGIPSRTEVEEYGKEFSRIILEGVEVELRQDLFDLMERGCPAVALVELMLLCTVGFRFTLTDVRHLDGITDRLLRRLKRNLVGMPKFIQTLTGSNFGPLSVLEESFPSKKEQRRVRHLVEVLPEGLEALEKLLKKYPPKVDPMEETIAGEELLLNLYLLLDYYGRHGDPTLSRVLTTMRSVKKNVSGDAKYLHKFCATPITSGKKKGETKDPFSERALQQRLYRFCKTSKVVPGNALESVAFHTGDAYAQQREQGKTLMDVRVEFGKERDEDDPERWVDLDAKNLKLDDKQRVALLSIYYEQAEQEIKVYSASFPHRKAKSPYLTVFSELLPTLVKIETSTIEKIRNVLNAEQKKKFDRQQQAADRMFESMEREASKRRKV